MRKLVVFYFFIILKISYGINEAIIMIGWILLGVIYIAIGSCFHTFMNPNERAKTAKSALLFGLCYTFGWLFILFFFFLSDCITYIRIPKNSSN